MLDSLFSPGSIAVIGASPQPDRIGGRTIKHLLAAGYSGKIYPVNPAHTEVQGLRCVQGLADIEEQVDCAVIAVPAKAVLKTVEECASAGVRSAVIFTAGFAELGPEGIQLQQEVAAAASRAGMRLLGPNTVGLYNVPAATYLTFSSAFNPVLPPGSRIGIASQSGGYSTYVMKLAQRRGIPVSHLAATGNEADVEVGDVMKWMAESSEIDIIFAYVEGLRSSDSFIEALDIAQRARKPVAILKVGSTAEGAAAAASHTASLAGSDNVYDTVFDKYGVFRAKTTQVLLDIGFAASCGRIPKGNRACLITSSGGTGVHMADMARDAGLLLVPMPIEGQEEIRNLSPTGSPVNPVDLTAQTNFGAQAYAKAFDIALNTGAYDVIVAYMGNVSYDSALALEVLASLQDLQVRHPDAVIGLAMLMSEEDAETYRQAGFFVFDDAARAVMAMGALCGFGRSFDRRKGALLDVPASDVCLDQKQYNEVSAKTLISRCGFQLPREEVVASADAARDMADSIGYPVALKVVSEDITHKTEVGGVKLGLKDSGAVHDAVVQMFRTVSIRAPDARVKGYLLSRMIEGGVECIVGITDDPVFGPIVMFGLGGVLVELLSDVAFRVAPINEDEAMDLIREVRSFPVLDGHRGKPKGDIRALAKAIATLSQMAVANVGRYKAIEVNPVLVMPEGQGVYALDANIVTEETEG